MCMRIHYCRGNNNNSDDDDIVEYFKHQSDHCFVYNLAVASRCPVSAPKLLFGTQGLAWWWYQLQLSACAPVGCRFTLAKATRPQPHSRP